MLDRNLDKTLFYILMCIRFYVCTSQGLGNSASVMIFESSTHVTCAQKCEVINAVSCPSIKASNHKSKKINNRLCTSISLCQALTIFRCNMCALYPPAVLFFASRSRQATINVGTIGHVAHGKSTVVKALSGVMVCAVHVAAACDCCCCCQNLMPSGLEGAVKR